MATGILFIALSLHSAPGRGATASSSRPLTLSTGGDGLTEGDLKADLFRRYFYLCISLQKLVERIPLPRSCLSFVRISFVSFPVVENVFVILLLLGDRGTIPSKQIERDVSHRSIQYRPPRSRLAPDPSDVSYVKRTDANTREPLCNRVPNATVGETSFPLRERCTRS